MIFALCHKRVYYALYMKKEDKEQEILKSLIIRAKEGDEGAFEELYNTYYTPLFRYILTRIKSKNEAEDMTQVIFTKIWKAIGSWDSSHTSPLSFFFTVARNTLIDHFRKNDHREIVSDEVVFEHAENIVMIENDTNQKDQILEAVAKLSEDQQEIIKLYYTNDLTYKEIAEVVGKREDTIRQIHSRAIKKLRELYKYE